MLSNEWQYCINNGVSLSGIRCSTKEVVAEIDGLVWNMNNQCYRKNRVWVHENRMCDIKIHHNNPNTQLLTENTNHFLAYINQKFAPTVLVFL